MGTLDFQAEIGAAGPGAYQVTLRAPDGAEATFDGLRLPITPDELRILSARIPDAILASSAVVRRSVPPEERPVQELGRILFDALLAGEGRALFASARHRAAEEDRQLRLVLRVRPPELARLPWEFLFDSGENGYVCTTMPLVRRPQVAQPQRPLTVAAPLRILCMAARPDDLEPLAVQAERDRLSSNLAGLERAGLVELGWVEGETWRDLRTALAARNGPWHILHFIGHGGFDPLAQEGTLALAGEDGGTYQLGAENLAMMLHDHRSLRLVVLNACETGRSAAADPFSSMGGALLRAGVPAALAMQYAISDRAAVEFARTFYEGLAHQLPVDAAVTEARQAIRLALPGTLEWGTPVLYMRSADGVLFEVAEPLRAERVRAEPAPADRVQTEPAPVEPVQAGPPPVAPPRADRPTVPQRPASVPSTARRAAFTRRFALHAGGLAPQPRVTPVRVPNWPWSLAFSPDSSRLAIGCEKWLTVVVDRRGERVCRVRAGGYLSDAADAVRSSFFYQDRVLAVSFDGAGNTFATVTGDSVRVWQTASGAGVSKRRLGMHSTSVVAVSEGGRIAAAAPPGSLLLSGPAGQTVISRSEAPVKTLAFSPGAAWIAVAGDGMLAPTPQSSGRSLGEARVWSVVSGEELLCLPHDLPVLAVAFSRDGTRLATGSGKLAHLWEFPSGEPVQQLAHRAGISGLAFGPDGTRLAAAHGLGATVWDLPSGNAVCEYRPQAQAPHGIAPLGPSRIAYSDDGTLLAVIEGKEVQLLDLTHAS
ncbi:CHAT domain-containing WD40 repeat protein [Streptomyces sp. NBC_01304]|uniref:CHAT domain-containing WD40 repeat protein n=1 Tax=Streptomyces sp. NBC_01304 TaxID=2903818 RepID=UPI002E1647CD|nr:CHAT domain-containing protein [Streptomyces sp. NBC_01304]